MRARRSGAANLHGDAHKELLDVPAQIGDRGINRARGIEHHLCRGVRLRGGAGHVAERFGHGMGGLRRVMRRIDSTALLVDPWTARICPPIASVALAVCTASDLTSEATTEKPRPASPARAASMVALSASRLVCSAIV